MEKQAKYSDRKCIIGVDPGVSTGICLYYSQSEFELHSLTFWQACAFFSERIGMIREVRIEDARKNKPTFGILRGAERDRRSQNVGSVKRDCSLWAEFFEMNQVKYQLIRPTKYSLVNVGHKDFVGCTGWKGGNTNQHKRDAWGLVFGLPDVNKKERVLS